MEEKANELYTVDVGSRLKQLRTERGMSMRSLARASGLSTNALSMIERSLTSPSVSTLYKISEALGIPITAFFRVEPPRQEIVFRKSTNRRRIEFHLGLWEGLGGESFLGNLEPFLLTLEPGGCSGQTGMIHTGQEVIFCLNGLLEYEIEGQVYLLEEGDCLIFSSQKKHRWCNPGDIVTRAIFVLTGFEQGESPSEFHVSSGFHGTFEEDDETGDLEDAEPSGLMN